MPSLSDGAWRDAYAAATLYQYDLRGNLSQDAHWLYTWDAENRLVVQEQKYPGTATDGARQVKRLEFSYDAMGRRISKKLLMSQKLSNGQLVGTWSFSKETVFIWQDWVLLAEFVRTSSGGNLELRRSYLWGLDVDGRLGGAGGVGGLLWVADYVPGQATSNRQLAPWYDGNGNVMGWMENDGAQPLPQHRLEYDPYGKLLVDDTVRPTLNQKQRNLGVSEAWLERPAFAFSTKYEDAETGLLYYGYRYYAPEMGQWCTRDPMEEKGGIGLYEMVGNNSTNRWDYLGLSWTVDGVLRVICCGDSIYHYAAEELSQMNVYSFKTTVETYKYEDGSVEVKQLDNVGGAYYNNEIYIRSNHDDKKAAIVAVHEVIHKLQARYGTSQGENDRNGEVEAYEVESLFGLTIGIPVRPDFLDISGNISHDQIRKWLDSKPEYNPKGEFVGVDYKDKAKSEGWMSCREFNTKKK